MRYGGGYHYHYRAPARRNHRPAPRRYYGGGGGGYGGGSRTPSEANNYSSEARQAPTSNDTAYFFPWNDKKECFDVPPHFDKAKSEGRITEHMLNNLFRDIHAIPLYSPNWPDPTRAFAIVTFLIGVLLFFGYLFSGLFTTYYTYEILQDNNKRYIEKKSATARFIEIPMVSVLVMVLGMVFGMVLLQTADYRESYRLKRRAFMIKKITTRHQTSTFEGTGCTVSSSPLAAYIKVNFDFKTPPPPPAPAAAPVQPAIPPPAAGPQPQALNTAEVELQPAVRFDEINLAKQEVLPEKTEVPKVPEVKDHPEAVSIQVPEEQPL